VERVSAATQRFVDLHLLRLGHFMSHNIQSNKIHSMVSRYFILQYLYGLILPYITLQPPEYSRPVPRMHYTKYHLRLR
jgi:hypothetical protein